MFGKILQRSHLVWELPIGENFFYFSNWISLMIGLFRLPVSSWLSFAKFVIQRIGPFHLHCLIYDSDNFQRLFNAI